MSDKPCKLCAHYLKKHCVVSEIPIPVDENHTCKQWRHTDEFKRHTVASLVEALQQFPQELDVMFPNQLSGVLYHLTDQCLRKETLNDLDGNPQTILVVG